MSTLAEAYYAEKNAESQRAAERAARVKQFVADSDPDIIADLFQIIRDAVIEQEAEAVLAMTKHYLSVKTVINDVQAEFYR